MDLTMLETAQMIDKHPIKALNPEKIKSYLKLLYYFIKKYSGNDIWSKSVFCLYFEKLLDNNAGCSYNDITGSIKKTTYSKNKPIKFFSYRYCLILDCIYMNAFNDYKKGKKIFREISEMYNKRYIKKLKIMFDSLYEDAGVLKDFSKTEDMQICWRKNRDYLTRKPKKIIVTANMSAGKSTLLNALVGRKVNKTQNDACTAKSHYILNKAFDDGFCYEYDYELELDADYNILMDDNSDNKSSEIYVGVHFRTICDNPGRIWFIDTPGVNFSQSLEQKMITEESIEKNESDFMIYVLNGENIGTDDDRKHLMYVREHYKGNVVFLINKVDKFRKSEDSVPDTLQCVRDDLEEMGFNEPTVVPVSAYAAYLAKMVIFGEDLNEDEEDEFNRLLRKLKKDEYRFDEYYPESIQKELSIETGTEAKTLLLHSGVLHLEKLIIMR